MAFDQAALDVDANKRKPKGRSRLKAHARVMKCPFETEAELVDRFVRRLCSGRSCYGSLQLTTEWDHRAGIVDVLARTSDGDIVAFEAKLKNWRRAFLQAYKNTAYASRSFVLLPPAAATRALAEREEFEFRGIGLCSFDGKKIQILISAGKHEPLLSWLQARAHEHFDILRHERRRSLGSASRGQGYLRTS